MSFWTTTFHHQKGPFQAGSLQEVCVTQKQQANSRNLNFPTSDSRVQKCNIILWFILHISENGLLRVQSFFEQPVMELVLHLSRTQISFSVWPFESFLWHQQLFQHEQRTQALRNTVFNGEKQLLCCDFCVLKRFLNKKRYQEVCAKVYSTKSDIVGSSVHLHSFRLFRK